MSDLFKVTLLEQVREVERELAARARVYPRMISNGQLTKARADRQTRSMQAVLETLQAKQLQEAGAAG